MTIEVAVVWALSALALTMIIVTVYFLIFFMIFYALGHALRAFFIPVARFIQLWD